MLVDPLCVWKGGRRKVDRASGRMGLFMKLGHKIWIHAYVHYVALHSFKSDPISFIRR